MAYKDLRERAEAGSVVAQGVLGMEHLFGSEDVPEDHAEAFRWLAAAAAAGAPRPSVWLGTMYEKGRATSTDVKRASELYEFGARRGEFYGCVFLARLLLSGRLGSADPNGALHWYQVAVGMNVVESEELAEARKFVSRHRGSAA
jgi:TPR repeat protein